MTIGGINMNNPMSIETPLKTDADYEAAIDRYLTAMDDIQRDLKFNRREIDRLHARNESKLQNLLSSLKSR